MLSVTAEQQYFCSSDDFVKKEKQCSSWKEYFLRKVSKSKVPMTERA